MATKFGVMAVPAVVLLLSLLSSGAMAQSAGQCANVLVSMASCLNYVSGSADSPPSSCCSSLANVVRTQPRCLCVIVDSGGSSLGVSINQTRALDLPQTCNVETPPASRCREGNGPAMAPGGAPEGSKTAGSNGCRSNMKLAVAVFVANTLVVFITAAFNIF